MQLILFERGSAGNEEPTAAQEKSPNSKANNKPEKEKELKVS